MDDKILITLASVALGWFLAQGTALAKDWWAARKFRAGLLIELADIQDQLQRVALIHSRHLQIYSIKGMEPTAALPIQNMFFKQYFKEAFSHLNRAQRISYQLIHGSLDSLNKKNDDLAKFAEDSYKELRLNPDEKKTLATIDVWGDRVIALYKTVMNIQWHIAYHLQNSNAPSFDVMGPMHENYVKFEQELDTEVKTIIENAKNFKREDFEKIYDEKAFLHNRNTG